MQRECTLAEFTCSNGQCLPLKWKCDRDKDCRDGGDEEGCGKGVVINFSPGVWEDDWNLFLTKKIEIKKN